GRVHVLAPSAKDPSVLEVIWSSPAITGSSASTPRFPQVGDCDGDGNPEIIFERGGDSKIVFFEWDPTAKTWGTEPAFYIDNNMIKAAGILESLRLTRETFNVEDYDGDGRSEIICHYQTAVAPLTAAGRNVYILGVENEFPGFAATLKVEGGHPSQVKTNGVNWATGSFWNSVLGDFDGDGKKEIINHHWNNYGFWSIDVKGPDTYVYPDTNSAKKDAIYAKYSAADDCSYFGVTACDVNGDKQNEIVGSVYSASAAPNNFDIYMTAFTKADTGVYIWKGDAQSMAARTAKIATKKDLAALGGKTNAEFWPCVKGDLNNDGKDEIYTGGSRGLNLIAIQYKGTGSLLDPASYTSNIIYKGEGGDVFAKYQIYNGRLDTVIVGKDTTYKIDRTKIDTVRVETPFTSYIFADNVDLNKNGKREIVMSEQSVYDSITVETYDWVDSTRQWAYNKSLVKKIFNSYRKTIRVLEFTGTTGVRDLNYSVVLPEDYKLEQNYPNPFNPSTSIRFTLPVDKQISLKIYDMLGKEIRTIIGDQVYRKGSYEMKWDGKNNAGQNVTSGHYIARLIYGNFDKSIKMTMLK
ncbi:MAG: FlgD immunoglobulin-like domain containing protein, partial [Syntrophothermus sp.]